MKPKKNFFDRMQNFPEEIRRIIASVLFLAAIGIFFAGWLAFIPARLGTLTHDDAEESSIPPAAPNAAEPIANESTPSPLGSITTSLHNVTHLLPPDIFEKKQTLPWRTMPETLFQHSKNSLAMINAAFANAMEFVYEKFSRKVMQ